MAGRRCKLVDDEVFILYNLGWNDQEMASSLGVCRQTIGKWRKRHGLPAHIGRLRPGGECPRYLFGVWPDDKEWPKDIHGVPWFLTRWDSAPSAKFSSPTNRSSRPKL